MIYFHWIELKYRLYYILTNFIITFIIIWNYKLEILFNIIELNLIYTSLTEAFNSYIYFCIIISIIINIPLLIYHYILFMIPGLYEFEFNNLMYNLIKYFILFIIFYYTCFNWLFKYIILFFIQFESNYLTLNLKITDFIYFYNSFILSFILLFSIPFINININGKRRFIYMSILILIALITPPDVLSLLISIIPIILIIELNYIWYLIKLDRINN
jgi:sec-independent protein translocase protein TatC